MKIFFPATDKTEQKRNLKGTSALLIRQRDGSSQGPTDGRKVEGGSKQKNGLPALRFVKIPKGKSTAVGQHEEEM